MPLHNIRFVADNNMGDIVKYMRTLGFDVFFDPSLCLSEIISISETQARILLTRNKNLLKHKQISHGILISPGTIKKQIIYIIKHLDIMNKIRPFSRCLLCNSLLVDVSKTEIYERIPIKTKEFCNEYTYCKKCDKIYWKGTHYVRMKKLIDEILEEEPNNKNSG